MFGRVRAEPYGVLRTTDHGVDFWSFGEIGEQDHHHHQQQQQQQQQNTYSLYDIIYMKFGGSPRMLLLIVLVREFEPRRGEILNLLAKIQKDQLLRAPSVGKHNSTVNEGRKS